MDDTPIQLVVSDSEDSDVYETVDEGQDGKGDGSAKDANIDSIIDVNQTPQTKNTEFQDARSEMDGESVEGGNQNAKGKDKDTTTDSSKDRNKDKNESKVDQPGEGENETMCDRKRRFTTMEKTMASIDRKRERMQSKENLPKKHCDAGRQCQLMGTAIEVDGEGKNAMGCATCR